MGHIQRTRFDHVTRVFDFQRPFSHILSFNIFIEFKKSNHARKEMLIYACLKIVKGADLSCHVVTTCQTSVMLLRVRDY